MNFEFNLHAGISGSSRNGQDKVQQKDMEMSGSSVPIQNHSVQQKDMEMSGSSVPIQNHSGKISANELAKDKNIPDNDDTTEKLHGRPNQIISM
jgi:hypothetical protein